MLGALAASIGRTGRPTSRPNAASAALPPDSAAAATTPSEPRSIMARRTSATGTSAARATASVITPSSAPWRSSPESRPTRNRCSSPVARPNSSPTSALRAAAEPFPDTAPIALNPESTSDRVSVGRGRRGEPVPQRRPADADLPLRQLTRQVGHGDRHLERPGLAQRGGQHLDLRQPGAGPRHRPRHLGDLTKQHAPILSRPAPAGLPRPGA